MKICFVSFEYPPLTIGGAGVYAVHITRELARLGHEIHVISPSISKHEIHSIEDDVFVHRIPILHQRFLSAPSFWFNLMRKYEAIRRDAGGFDILHGNVVSDFSLSKRWVKEPRVVTVHHLAHLMAQHSSSLKRLLDLSGEIGVTPTIERIVITRAHKIIAVSNFTKETIVSTYNKHPSAIEVIYHGVRSEEYNIPKHEVSKLRDLLGLRNEITFLFVGRLNDKRKNLLLLLRAFKFLLKKTTHPVKLVITGSGEQSRIKALVDSLGLAKNVVLTGYIKDYQLRKIFKVCDIFVSPSVLEGFGLTLLEAMAAGKPVIATKVGGVVEVVKDPENGKLVASGDVEGLTNALMFFIENRELTEEIGEHNKRYAASMFSWEKTAKKTEQVYRDAIVDAT